MTAQMAENFLQAAAAGLLVGAIYGLMCVGLALIFGVMRVINFAQGDIMMLDNMLAAHGRNPYEGERKIVVALGEMCHEEAQEAQVSATAYQL